MAATHLLACLEPRGVSVSLKENGPLVRFLAVAIDATFNKMPSLAGISQALERHFAADRPAKPKKKT